MISILIPIYNRDCKKLIHEVYNQCFKEKIPFEIIAFDDCSTPKWKDINRPVANMQHVVYQELQQHISRSKIRNLMAEAAQYPYLLFLDNDVAITKQDFIRSYISACSQQCVVYGGMTYERQPPSKQQKLRWKYGRRKECVAAKERQKHQYQSFNTINVLIAKDVFELIQFDESISTYGHEDTLFGFALQQKQIPILHIENPVVHHNTVSNKMFIEQTKQAIDNLSIIDKKLQGNQEFRNSVKLLKTLTIIERFHLCFLLKCLYEKFHFTMEFFSITRNSLFAYNILKISYMCSINN